MMMHSTLLALLATTMLGAWAQGTGEGALATTTPSTCADFLAFDTDKVVVTDDGANQFMVRMLQKPVGPFNVFLSAPGIQFDVCALAFTPDNYATPQRVRILPDAGLFNAPGSSTNFIVTLSAKFNCRDTVACTQRLTVERKYTAPAGTCTSWGDPHQVTFGNVDYSVQLVGDYYFFKSQDIAIQVRQAPYTPGTAINSMVAIRYGQEWVTLDAAGITNRNEMRVKQSADRLVYVSMSRDATTGAHTVTLASGVTLTITPREGRVNDQNTVYLDLILTVGAGTVSAKHGGLCGKLGGGAVLEDANGKVYTPNEPNLTPPRMSVEADINAFSETWKVKPEENMFLGKFPGAPLSRIDFVPQTCSLSPEYDMCVLPPLPPYVVVLAKDLDYVGPLPPPLVSTIPNCQISQIMAAEMCRASLAGSSCRIVAYEDSYISSCIVDTLATCQMNTCEGARQAFNAECHRLTSLMIGSANRTAATLGRNVQLEEALGSVPARCSGNGVDSTYGCLCKLGFTGKDCSIRVPDPVTPPIDPSKPACNGRGVKSTYGCHCEAGYTGFDCSIPVASVYGPSATATATVLPTMVRPTPVMTTSTPTCTGKAPSGTSNKLSIVSGAGHTVVHRTVVAAALLAGLAFAAL